MYLSPRRFNSCMKINVCTICTSTCLVYHLEICFFFMLFKYRSSMFRQCFPLIFFFFLKNHVLSHLIFHVKQRIIFSFTSLERLHVIFLSVYFRTFHKQTKKLKLFNNLFGFFFLLGSDSTSCQSVVRLCIG